MASVYGYNTPGDMRVFYPKPKDKPCEPMKDSVLEFIQKSGHTTIFAYILAKANLEWLVNGPMFENTIFVPVDESLRRKYSVDVFKNMSEELAFKIVKYSIMQGKIERWLLNTLNFSELVVSSYDRIEMENSAGNIVLNGKVRVLRGDKTCCNGVVLFTDDLLVPYTM